VLAAILRLQSDLLVKLEPIPQDCIDDKWKWFKVIHCSIKKTLVRTTNILYTTYVIMIQFYVEILRMLSDAILPRKGPVTRAMSKRLQEDWTKVAEEGSRILMNLRVDFLAHGPRLGPLFFVNIRISFPFLKPFILAIFRCLGYPTN